MTSHELLIYALERCIEVMEEHNRDRERTSCPWDFGDGFNGALDQARTAVTKAA